MYRWACTLLCTTIIIYRRKFQHTFVIFRYITHTVDNCRCG